MITDAELRQFEKFKLQLADQKSAYEKAMADVDDIVLAEAPEAGRFSGYAALFASPCLKGDVIRPGAFAASLAAWRAKGKWPPMLMEHGEVEEADSMICSALHNLPFGQWVDMHEDELGLRVTGRLLALDTLLCRVAWHRVGSRKVRLSIGGRVKKRCPTSGACIETELQEISLVAHPGQLAACVDRWEPCGRVLFGEHTNYEPYGVEQIKAA